MGEDNNSKIKLSTDRIDLTNANVGEKVGDYSLALDLKPTVEIGIPAIVAGISTPVVVGVVTIGGIAYYTSMPEEQKEELKEEIYEIYQDVKKVLVVY